MYIKRIYGCVISKTTVGLCTKGLLDTYHPPTIESNNFKHWVATLDIKTCMSCFLQHGKIYSISEPIQPSPPLHPHCRCAIEPMQAVAAGNATKDGKQGADWWLKYVGLLPDYYITLEELYSAGWKHGKPPVKFAPGKMITAGIYHNDDGHLPQAPGRVWYEADINYYEGRRNGHRVLWSNDGLMFATYDHYRTFYEII